MDLNNLMLLFRRQAQAKAQAKAQRGKSGVDSTALRLRHTGGSGSGAARRRRGGGAFPPAASAASAAAFETWEAGREVR